MVSSVVATMFYSKQIAGIPLNVVDAKKCYELRKINYVVIYPFRNLYQNDQFFNSFTMYSNSSSYNSSYMDSIDSKIPPIDFKLGEEGPDGLWDILSHISYI